MSQLRLFAGAGFNVTHATIDALRLPACESGWTVLSDSGGWLLRTHENSVAHLTEPWLAQLLAHYPPQEVVSYGPLPTGLSAKETRPACHSLILHPQEPPANLLHGKMRPPAPCSFLDHQYQTRGALQHFTVSRECVSGSGCRVFATSGV